MPDSPLAEGEYQRPDSPYDRIEPDAFRIVEMQRIPKETTPFLIESALEGFGVALVQLGRLLETSRVHVSSWRNGRLRLSAAYSGRLLALWSLRNEGIPIQLAHHVHWRTGTIGEPEPLANRNHWMDEWQHQPWEPSVGQRLGINPRTETQTGGNRTS